MSDRSDTNRLEAFSDGVFAVAITLLVLDIKMELPLEAKNEGNNLFLYIFTTQWPALLAFVISFFTIGIMWLNHHRLFKHIRKTNTNLILLNLFLLWIIVFVPVPTNLLAQSLTTSNELWKRDATLIYSGTFLLMALAFFLLWRYATLYDGHLLGEHVDHEGVENITRQYRFGPLLYLTTTALALLNIYVSLGINFALALFFAWSGSFSRPDRHTSPKHLADSLSTQKEDS